MCHFRSQCDGENGCRWEGEPICGWVTLGGYPFDREGLIEAKAQEYELNMVHTNNLHRVTRGTTPMGLPIYTVQECFMCLPQRDGAQRTCS